MKVNTKVLALMAALATGAASAATQAGTEITNTATASFQIVNPDGTTSAGPGATSNTVKTVVSSVPNFTIELNDTAATSTTNYAAPAQTKSAVPGTTVSYLYTLTNTGNVPNESYTLGNTAPSATNGGTGIQAGTPTYYKDDGDSIFEPGTDDTVITSITGVNPGVGNAVKFWVAYPIAGSLANGVKVGTSPVGTRVDNPGFADENSILPVDANNSNVTTVNRTTSLALGPKDDADGNGPSLTYTTPETFTVTVNTNDSQTAAADVVPDKITFTNTVNNTSNVPDTYTLSATTAGLPTGTTVKFYDLSGNEITQITVGAGQTASFRTVVDYPTGLSLTDFAQTNSLSDSVTVTATSQFDTSVSNTTVNQVSVTKRVVDLTSTFPGSTTPGASAGTPVDLSTCTSTGVVMSIPVTITNTGSVADKYDLSGTATGVTPTTITYYDTVATTGGNVVTVTDTLLPGESQTVYARITVACGTPSGQSITLNPVATSQANGTVTDTQAIQVYVGANNAGLGLAKFVKGGTAGTYNGVISPSGYGLGTGSSVAPTGTIEYVIIGKNFYNAEVRNVILSDDLDLNVVTYASASCAVYSDNGTPTDYTDDVLRSAKTCTVSNDSTTGVVTTTGVSLASGEYVRLNLSVTVK